MRSRPTTRALAVCASATLALTAACADGGGVGGTGATNGGGDSAELIANNPQERDALEEGGTFTRPVGSFPTNFNRAHIDGNLGEYEDITSATNPSLFLYSPDGEVSPRTEYLEEMPETDERDGKQVITYTLNPQAVWNDGTKIDWTAFEAAWKAQREPVQTSGYNNIATTGYEDIESVAQGENDNEVVVTMKKPFYPVTNLYGSVIHPKLGENAEAFNTLMKDDWREDLRSGPFTLESLDKQAQTIVLKPNERWWGNKPLLNRVVFRQMETSATIPAFKNGEIDMTSVSTRARLAEIEGTANMELRRNIRLATVVYVFNSEAEGLTDINVRKAIWQGTNREELKQVRFAGLDWTEDPVNSYLFFSFQPEAADNYPVEFDVEAAKRTLEDAGYVMGSDGFYAKDGQKLTVTYTNFGDDPLTVAQGQTTQNQMKAIGIDLQLDIRPSAAFGEAFAKRDFGFLAMAWGSGGPSPMGGLCQIMCSDSDSNYAKVGDAELDARMRAAGEIEDEQQQNDEVNDIEKQWLQYYGQMPLWNGPDIYATRQGLANYGPAGFEWLTPKWEDVGWVQGSTHN